MTGRPLYQFCPFCSTPLQDSVIGGRTLPRCPACGFVHYPDPKVAVIARIEHRQRLLLVRRAINPGKGLWALPGGYMDAGEMPEAALQREIREEVDLAISVQELLAIYPMVNQRGDSQGIVLVYRALPSAEMTRPPAALDDVSEARWFTIEELPAALAFVSTATELQRWADEQNTEKESKNDR